MTSRISIEAQNAYRKGIFAGKQRLKAKAPENISLYLTGLWQQGHSIGLQMVATKPLPPKNLIEENQLVSESQPHLADFLNEEVAKEAMAEESAKQNQAQESVEKTHELYRFTEESTT
jgi:hypothetical protein